MRSYNNRHKNHDHYINPKTLRLYQHKCENKAGNSPYFKLLAALADPTKFKIVWLLFNFKTISVSDISTITGVSHSAISHALSDLKKINLVSTSRCGQVICYSIKKGRFFKISRTLVNVLLTN